MTNCEVISLLLDGENCGEKVVVQLGFRRSRGDSGDRHLAFAAMKNLQVSTGDFNIEHHLFCRGHHESAVDFGLDLSKRQLNARD